MRKVLALSLCVLAGATGLTAGLGSFSAPASAQMKGPGICWLYNVNYARRMPPGAGPAIAETVVTVKNPAAVPYTVIVEWIDTANTTIGLSPPTVLAPKESTEFATVPVTPVALGPFGADVPGLTPAGGPMPSFEGGARIYRVDPACTATNSLNINGQMILEPGYPSPKYIHVKIDRKTGLTGD